MKKVLAVCTLLFFLLYAGSVFGQTWYTANQATVAWDAVTTLDNGDPIPTTDTVEYVVYLANATTDPNKTNPVEVGRTTNLEDTITLNVEGSFFVGCQAIRKDSAGTQLSASIIGWSDDPAIVFNGQTFGIRYFLPPSVPAGLRPSGG